ELLGGAGARELAQPPQRDLDIASAELDLVVEVPELAPVPDLDRAPIAALLLADAHALRIVAIGAVGRGAGGADPLAAALVAALLLGEPLAQGLEQLVEAAHGLDHLLLLVGEVLLGEFLEPLGRNLDDQRVAEELKPLEHVTDTTVDTVDMALALAQRCTEETAQELH